MKFNKKLLFLFGAPGAGKGVSAQILKESFGFKHLSMGEFFRSRVLSNDPLISPYTKEINQSSGLVPDSVVNMIFSNFIKANSFSNCVVDGYPRTTNQMFFLDQQIKLLRRDIFFFFLEADDNLLVKRLLSRQTCSECAHDYIFETPLTPGYCDICKGKLYKRETDTEVVIKKRINVFNATTRKIIMDLEDKYSIYKIDANRDIHEIYKEILSVANLSKN